MVHRLSWPNSNLPNACLAINAKIPTPNWILRINLHNLSSLLGPNHTKVRFINVILVQFINWPLLSYSKSISLKKLSSFKMGMKNPLAGVSCKLALLGYNNPSFSLKCGNLCLGQGTMWNNCGTEYRKLIICGRNSNSIVFEKCPNIPTTANTMPAK